MTMVTTKKPRLLSWHVAVLEVLLHARVRKAWVAREIGSGRSELHRQLDGDRPVDLPLAKQINRAIGVLAGDSNLEGYLTAVFAAGQRHADDALTKSALIGFRQAFGMVAHYFVPDALARILEFLDDEWTSEQGLALLHAINVASHRRLIKSLDGKIEGRTQFDELLKICGEHGLPLEPLMRNESELKALRARDELHVLVHQGLAASNEDVAIRSKWEGRIMQAVSALDVAVRADAEAKLMGRRRRGYKRAVQEARNA
jgi:hypothetical protein